MGFRSDNAIIVDGTAHSIDPAQTGTRKVNAHRRARASARPRPESAIPVLSDRDPTEKLAAVAVEQGLQPIWGHLTAGAVRRPSAKV